MKVQVRHGVFETNSSSTHTLTVYNISEWKEFEDGKVLLNDYHGGFITEEKARELFKEECKKHPDYYDLNNEDSFFDFCRYEGIYTYEEYSERYEVLTEEIGDKTAVSIYGYE